MRCHRGHTDAPHEHPDRRTFAGKPILGDLSQMHEIYGRAPFDVLVLPATSELARDDGEAILRVLNFCEEKAISLYSLPDSYNVAVAQREVGSFSGMPILQLQDASLHRGYALIKRAMDIAGALIGIVLGMPLWLLIAVLIRCTSKGPVFFTQMRAGLHGRPFRIFKFRTMVADAEARLGALVNVDKLKEPVFKIKNDPRVTPVGRLLRRTSLDEVPQLINVLKGEMSLIGPRPEECGIVARYNHWQRRRLKAKPGITGLQQITNRGSASLSERIKYDLIYLKHQSLLLDLYVLGMTVVVVFRGSGVTH